MSDDNIIDFKPRTELEPGLMEMHTAYLLTEMIVKAFEAFSEDIEDNVESMIEGNRVGYRIGGGFSIPDVGARDVSLAFSMELNYIEDREKETVDKDDDED